MKLLLTVSSLGIMSLALLLPHTTQAVNEANYCSMQKPIGTYETVRYGNNTQAWIATDVGNQVVAMGDGVVTGVTKVRTSQWHNKHKKPSRVVIQHDNGTRTISAQLSQISVEKGDRVEAGQEIGQSGGEGQGSYRSTGPHVTLHMKDASGARVSTNCVF